MDFLDSRKRRSHKIRLIIGYVLMSIAIGLATVILVYDTYGYGINTKTGDIVQNGLLFVDSKPGGADIYLNGRSQNSTTAARLILPAANYTLQIRKSGYRDWQRTFTLTEHSVDRYIYPFLFPTNLLPKTIKTYDGSPGLVSQSPDKRWLLVQTATGSPTISFDEYDTADLKQPPKSLALPGSLLTNPGKPGDSLTEIEWSSDNVHVLLQHNYSGGSEFIIINRQSPAGSINLNKQLGVSPTQVALRDKKADQVYVFDKKAGSLLVGNIAKGSLTATASKKVLAFKSYGSNLIVYATDSSTPGVTAARIWDNGQDYLLNEFNAGNIYLLDVAQFQNHWYYVAGSDVADRLNIYKDPIDNLKNPSLKKATPLIALRLKGATTLSFSANTRFVGATVGQKFAVYDIEDQASYGYTLSPQLSTAVRWMDGHRWLSASEGKVFVMDYDRINQQSLAPTMLAGGGFFDKDYNQLFTLVPVAGSNTFALQATDMRAGADLPKP